MEDSKAVAKQHGEVSQNEESGAARNAWVKPMLKRLALKEALISKATTPVDGGSAPFHGS